MARILFVSKPLVPPWSDSSKNLARDVAEGLRTHEPVVLTDGSGAWRPPRGTAEPLYRAEGRYAPGLGAQLRVLRRLALGRRMDLWHFFFAPNPRSSAAGRALARVRRAPTVQTVCSRPRDLARAKGLLFADRTIVLSRDTLERLHDAGVPAERLAHIPPAVPPLAPLDDEARAETRRHFELPADAPVIVYPGDLELGDGAPRALDALARLGPEPWLVMACRAKTPAAADEERRLRARAAELGVAARVRWAGETRRIHALLGAADLVVLPSSDLYGKMDLPLVLLEAMWMARPVVVTDDAPSRELADGGAAIAVAPDDLADAIERHLGDAELGAAAREAAAVRYHPERMVAAYEAVYDALLN